MHSGNRTYPLAPTSFEDLIRLIPPRGKISSYRFMLNDRPFEVKIGRNDLNVVFLEFGVPDDKNEFYNCIRTVGSLTTQRAIWSVWERFLKDPDEYLTLSRADALTQH